MRQLPVAMMMNGGVATNNKVCPYLQDSSYTPPPPHNAVISTFESQHLKKNTYKPQHLWKFQHFKKTGQNTNTYEIWPALLKNASISAGF